MEQEEARENRDEEILIREEIHCLEQSKGLFHINDNTFRRNWEGYPDSKEGKSDLM